MMATQYTTSRDSYFAMRSLNPSENHGEIKTFCRSEETVSDFLGFGVAITASSCYNLAQMPKERRRAVLEDLYGKDGLGLRIGRISVGSSDYSTELYSYDDTRGDLELKDFSIGRDREFIIPIIKEILEINPEIYFYASPWTPPAWMKTGGSLCGGYMRREFIECYAEYIVRFIKEYEKCGIKISAITPQNEPETEQGGKMPACIWHPDIEAEFVTLLKRRLAECGLQVKVLIHDHNFGGWKRVKNMLDTHSELKDLCDGIAFHYYEGAVEDTVQLRDAYPSLPMHFTEGGPRLYDNYGTDWCKWGIIISKLLGCGYKSFTGWNLMLDEKGGPQIGPFSCGGLVTLDSRTGELTYSGQYKALAHFSKFIKEKSKAYRVEQDILELPMSSFKNGEGVPLQIACVENLDSTVCYFAVNADLVSKELLISESGQLYRVEMPPESLSTVVIEK